MKGDFSTWRFDPEEDHQGVLYQQGRLITDADLTEGEAIAVAWRLAAGRDIVGAGVAAVPAEEPDGWQVLSAVVDGETVLVSLHPGWIWADGLRTRLKGEPPDENAPVMRRASYLPPPHNPPGTSTAQVGDDVRDAVVLEFGLEALNGFQNPARLIEPALGGPDTAERLITRAGIRLLRLAPGEDCSNIGDRLREPDDHGRLTVSLEPPTVVPGDCPVVEGGGYSGFEHNLYRIEIAETNAGPVRFKWSQVNGGLVGRGTFHGGADPRVIITANRSAILHSGLTEFYLEAVEFDAEIGHWRVTYGAPASLNADGELDLTQPPTFGAMPGAAGPVFFRLWNGIRPVSDFTNAADPVELRDGIRLAFEPPAGASYRPGSWWNFDVRAGEIANPEVLLDDAAPEGPMIRRVALAEIEWTDAQDTTLGGEIEDCRRRFRPLSNQKVCCTYIVGNGTTTFGDFNSLEEAAAHLPPAGGKLCLLPGIHFANLSLIGLRGVQIEGCRHRTFVLPRPASVDQPIIRVLGGQDISVREVDMIAPFGAAVEIAGSPESPLREVRVEGCRIMALTHGIHVETVEDVRIIGNRIWLLDHPMGQSVISLRATGALIERNHCGVWPFEFSPPGDEDDDDREEPPDPSDPCIEPEDLFGNLTSVIAYVTFVWAGSLVATPPQQPYQARGGFHVKGGSTRVDILRNRIDGGLGHGITLGGVFPTGEEEEDDDEQPVEAPTVRVVGRAFFAVLRDEQGQPEPGRTVTLTFPGASAPAFTGVTDDNGEVQIPAAPGSYTLGVEPGLEILGVESVTLGAGIVYIVSVGPGAVEDPNVEAGFLTRIRIHENEIERMGLSGIGFWFYDLVPDPPLPSGQSLEGVAEMLSALFAPKELIGTTNLVRDLEIRGNRIENNLRAAFTDEMRATALFVAQGGISLALVEGLKIVGNHISGNGGSAAEPCAGIFAGYVEEALITDNYIVGNGPVAATYRELRSEGLRGGIFIRLASAVVAGGTADGQQKPALVIADNVVDQPAGRAITALAYGPVSCVGNTLNAETEGAWSSIDMLVGGVLILNLGGIHRMQAFANVGGAFVQSDSFESDLMIAAAFEPQVEAMLPGGETMFNSNRVRTGPDNLCWTSMVIATVDDLGFANNQSGMFRPDVTFCNTVGFAHSLRMTGNRFRERAFRTGLSALSLTTGTTVSGGASAMNITAHNQGDHCIIAVSQGAIPVEDRPNQVVHSQFCPGQRDLSTNDYLGAAVMQPLHHSVSPNAQLQDGAAAVDTGLKGSISGVSQVRIRTNLAYQGEAQRLHVMQADAPVVQELRAAGRARRESAEALEVQADLARVREAELPDEGALLDGRVADSKGRAAAGQTVELVDRRGRPLGVSTETDEHGYYALAIDEETRRTLGRRDDVFVRVTDASGDIVTREPKRIVIGDDPLVRTPIEITARPPKVPVRPTDTTSIFTRSRIVPRDEERRTERDTGIDTPDSTREEPPAERPPRDTGADAPPRDRVEPEEPERRVEEPRERDVTPDIGVRLEDVRGVGGVTARLLRSAGVADAESLSRLSDAEATRIIGASGPRLTLSAREALEIARRRREEEG
ncbi:hypothetical protein [Roseitranquillus sediminis]|uniref:hypothetical protein n=1 Tax=Roseitranquillus sediminis TaxID=2809051 RepID=UPI001D0CA1FA|nr:hypothetical protein [Roseitranquillus sediminis]MBM9594973.1 right-handed parallel beta-helix repeat-containing protein [Roseitranquillus sediminis]